MTQTTTTIEAAIDTLKTPVSKVREVVANYFEQVGDNDELTFAGGYMMVREYFRACNAEKEAKKKKDKLKKDILQTFKKDVEVTFEEAETYKLIISPVHYSHLNGGAFKSKYPEKYEEYHELLKEKEELEDKLKAFKAYEQEFKTENQKPHHHLVKVSQGA